jgi:N-methylhydantoinase A
MSLDIAAAQAVMQPMADKLELSLQALAEGIIEIANEHMARALRVMSVQRGLDPADFQLMCFGGAGGLHVCALAEAMGMRQAIVPVHGGVLSALGMLAAPRSRELSRTHNGLLADLNAADIEEVIQSLQRQGQQALHSEGVQTAEIRATASLDCRYAGQSYTLNISWLGCEASIAQFHETHASRFGHTMDEAVELVNIRLHLCGPQPDLALPKVRAGRGESAQIITLAGDQQVKMLAREDLPLAESIDGPLLITEQVSTTLVAAGWRCSRDEWGNLLLRR